MFVSTDWTILISVCKSNNELVIFKLEYKIFFFKQVQ